MNKILLAAGGLSILSAVAFTTPASAAAYLVGAQVYAAGEIGENRGGNYQYSTNASTSHYDLLLGSIQPFVNTYMSRAVSFKLSEGANQFTFEGLSASIPTSIVGLNLFFSDTAVSYNPSFQSGVGIPGNLTVFSVAGSSGFGVPSAGTNVASYSNDGAFNVNPTSSSGAASLQIGGETVSVSTFASTRYPSGSFTLAVSPASVTQPVPSSVPEPVSLALLSTGLLGLCAARRATGRKGS